MWSHERKRLKKECGGGGGGGGGVGGVGGGGPTGRQHPSSPWGEDMRRRPMAQVTSTRLDIAVVESSFFLIGIVDVSVSPQYHPVEVISLVLVKNLIWLQ